jgi:hypothetical protein
MYSNSHESLQHSGARTKFEPFKGELDASAMNNILVPLLCYFAADLFRVRLLVSYSKT